MMPLSLFIYIREYLYQYFWKLFHENLFISSLNMCMENRLYNNIID